MSQLFQNGLQYRTINNYMSAISAFMTTFKRSQWGNTPEFVVWLLVFLIVEPRYCFIWNIQTVIDFIKSEWGQNEDLSDRYFTYKLTMLLALTSVWRVLQHLDIRFMTKGANNYMFTFGKLHEASRKG